MIRPTCCCGHEKRDHILPRAAVCTYGPCKVCLCDGFKKVPPPMAVDFETVSCTALKSDAPIIEWIIDRIERKCCPQGLNVIEEELRWMGFDTITHDKLVHAVALELRSHRPRIETVAEGVYWFAGRTKPSGWSLFGDKRMLPCFYREYPPYISWDELDRPENILPSPKIA